MCDYAREVSDPAARELYEAETVLYEREQGVKCTFLHPKPGYVLKTNDLAKDEKTFLNICSDPAVGQPTLPRDEVEAAAAAAEAAKEIGGRGVPTAIPFSLTKQSGRGVDKGGRPCSVYDVVFHPDALQTALQGKEPMAATMKKALSESAMDGVEKLFDGVVLDRSNVKYPKMKFKGRSEPTVIREKIGGGGGGDNDNVTSDTKEPKYKMVLRSEGPSLADYDTPGGGRPTQIQVDVELPEFDSAKCVDLDVTTEKLVLTSTEPVVYNLTVSFPYPVESENGAAKFHKQERRLTVTVPVKPASEVRRLVSTDSGYGGGELEDHELALSDGGGDDAQVEEVQNHLNRDDDDPDDLMFPPYSCKIYENLMIFTLDVKKVDESSLNVDTMLAYDEPYGFSLKFTSIGRGFVPFRYGFYCAFVVADSHPRAAQQPKPEIEVWDNNLIVKVGLPKGVDCQQYRVGSSASDLTLHLLPQLHRAYWKRHNKMAEDEAVSASNVSKC